MTLKFSLYLNCENEAFTEAADMEIARILRNLADRVEGLIRYDAKGTYSGNLRDLNGNTVGCWMCSSNPKEHEIIANHLTDPA